ncbi:MAG: hypothetical protein V8R63_10880 [Thomasclavelia ramosa]
MRTWAFAKRTTKEILRDPINIIFGLGFPIVILLLLTTIQKNIPATPFSLKQLTQELQYLACPSYHYFQLH